MALKEFVGLPKTGLRIIIGLPTVNSLMANNNVFVCAVLRNSFLGSDTRLQPQPAHSETPSFSRV